MVSDDDVYREAAADWRHYDNVIWQLPSVSIALTTGIIAATFTLIDDNFVRFIILLIGTFLMGSLAFSLVKHRLFHNARTDTLEDLEAKYDVSFPIKRRTYIGKKGKKRKVKENDKFYTKWNSAYRWLLLSMIASSISLLILAIYQLVLNFGIL